MVYDARFIINRYISCCAREQEKEILYCGVQVCIQLCLGLYCVLVLLVGIQMVQDLDQHVSELSPNHAVVLYNDAHRFLFFLEYA
jgi:hypothetical protein